MQKILVSIFTFFLLCASVSPALALTMASWNLEWLATNPPHHSKLKIPKRSSADFNQLNTIFRQQNVDILAFQEVNDIAALKRVVGNGYTIWLSDRSKPEWRKLQFNDINQYTGFAIRNTLVADNPADVELISGKKLRFATYLILKRGKQSDIHLLSVHLKSGCFGQWKSSKRACTTLKQQGIALKLWIEKHIRQQDSFIILGDFNHNLSYPKDWFWTELSGDNTRHLTLATSKTPSECKMSGRNGKIFRYRYLIDHIITSKDISVPQPKQWVYPDEVLQHYRLSDHCLLVGQVK